MALVVLIGTLLSMLLSFVLSPFFSPFSIVAFGSAYVLSIIQGGVSLAITAFTSGALISMVNLIEEGQTVSVGRGVQAGLRRLVPLFVVTLTLQIPIWLVAFLQTRSLLYAFTSNNQSSFANPNLLLSTGVFYFIFNLSITLLIQAIGVGAERALVLEKRSVFAALKIGLGLLWRKLKDFVIIGFIFLLLTILVFVLFTLMSSTLFRSTAFSPIAGPQNAVFGLSSTFFNPTTAVFFILSILFGLFVAVFVSGVWTLAFREWQAQERSELSVAAE
jgi:hypothetical protein